MTNTQSTIDLHQYGEVLRSRKWALILPVVIALALAAAYVFLAKPQYTAVAKVLVNPIVTPSTTTATAKGNTPDMNTEQAAASSTPVAVLARRTLRVSGANGDHLVNHLQISAATTGNILQFAYTSTDATQAAQYANAFAHAYLTYRNSTALGPLAAAAAERQHTIAALEQQVPHAGSAQRAVLLTQIRDDALQLAQFQADQKLVSAGMVIGVAVPPSSPSSPKVTKTLLIAGVIGLVVGICLALIREAMDGRIKSPEELESRLRAPVLGVIPKFGARSPDRSLATIADPRGAASEAYRMTAIALENLTARGGLRVIMIVSPEDGGGASTATANLGVVLAQAGHRVILVSADLRDPRLHLIFGLSNGHGLSTALLEGTDAERLLKEAHIPNLYVLTAGPEPKDPAALLSSPATAEVLTTLRGLEPDFVLVDTPPVLSASDAVILSRQVDGTVLTWNGEDFEAPALQKAQERLHVAGANILGGIYAFDRSTPSKRKGPKRGGAPRPEAPFVPRETRQAAVGSSRADARYDRVDAASAGGRMTTGSSRSLRDGAPGRSQL
jgi:capsular exopolysaccharide synthesis family protein